MEPLIFFFLLIVLITVSNVILIIIGLVKRKLKIIHPVFIIGSAILIPFLIFSASNEVPMGRLGFMQKTLISALMSFIVIMIVAFIFLINRLKKKAIEPLDEKEELLDESY